MCICKYESKEFKTEVFDQQAKKSDMKRSAIL